GPQQVGGRQPAVACAQLGGKALDDGGLVDNDALGSVDAAVVHGDRPVLRAQYAQNAAHTDNSSLSGSPAVSGDDCRQSARDAGPITGVAGGFGKSSGASDMVRPPWPIVGGPTENVRGALALGNAGASCPIKSRGSVRMGGPSPQQKTPSQLFA